MQRFIYALEARLRVITWWRIYSGFAGLLVSNFEWRGILEVGLGESNEVDYLVNDRKHEKIDFPTAYQVGKNKIGCLDRA